MTSPRPRRRSQSARISGGAEAHMPKQNSEAHLVFGRISWRRWAHVFVVVVPAIAGFRVASKSVLERVGASAILDSASF